MVKVGSVYMGNLGQTSLGSDEGFLLLQGQILVLFFVYFCLSLSLSESFTYFLADLELTMLLRMTLNL